MKVSGGNLLECSFFAGRKTGPMKSPNNGGTWTAEICKEVMNKRLATKIKRNLVRNS
jgi:hypothetical protein